VVAGVETPGEAFGTGGEQAQHGLVLAGIKFAAYAIQQLRLAQEERDLRQSSTLPVWARNPIVEEAFAPAQITV